MKHPFINGLSLMILLLTFLSCKKEEINHNGSFEYLIFGHFYGECIGDECVEIFKIEKSELYKDSNDNYPTGSAPYIGNYQLLSKELYQTVEELPVAIPPDLLELPSGRIGCPDCADGGGIYIELKVGDNLDYWLIDQVLENIPQALHQYLGIINAKIGVLSYQ